MNDLTWITTASNKRAYARLPGSQREHDDRGWLKSARSYPAQVLAEAGVRTFPLVVIAEDKVAAGRGFGLHGHRDMEILSYIISGSLKHADTTGFESTAHAGGIHVMTAGSGIEHSEFNGSNEEAVHFLQIWISPKARGVTPSARFAAFDTKAPLTLLASPSGGLLPLNQDVEVWRVLVSKDETVTVPISINAQAWLHVVDGRASVDEDGIGAGDGLTFLADAPIAIRGETTSSEVLVFVSHAVT